MAHFLLWQMVDIIKLKVIFNVIPLWGLFGTVYPSTATCQPVAPNDIPANATQRATFSSGHN